MFNLLTDTLIKGMIAEACSIAVKYGLQTRNGDLLRNTARAGTLSVRNGRIFPSAEAMEACLAHIRDNHVPAGDVNGNHHGWEDMIINHFPEENILIKITDLPYQYCDHKSRHILPLTRKQVIEGTKLLHVLSEKKGVKGYACGVPQDTAAPLKAVEQYLIGFMYNRNGGGTIQPVAAEVEDEFAKIRTIAENRGDPGERSVMLFSSSPLILDSNDLYLFFKPGIKISAFMTGSMPMMGMTGPVDPAGVYVQGLAEVLGGAAILHALFPEARAYVYPHPQAMDLRSGRMAFGTVEHARLEMMKIQVMNALGLPYYNLKDIMTSAQMPGSLAQGDKALGFFTGIMAGYKAFNLMPLSTDQVWSPVQALLDVEALTGAWKALKPVEGQKAVTRAADTIGEVLENKGLFAETADTLMNMELHYRTDMLHNRFQTSEAWQQAGRPEELDAVEQKQAELLGQWDYHPPEDKFQKIMDIYYKLCHRFNTEPMDGET
jgi:trimethylamine:corrinoid methyltransferase-like protein